MKRTVSASLWTMMSLPSCARYPSGGTPPIHIPFFFEAAILSRMRSPMTLSLADRDRRADYRGTLVGSPVLWRQQASACILCHAGERAGGQYSTLQDRKSVV